MKLTLERPGLPTVPDWFVMNGTVMVAGPYPEKEKASEVREEMEKTAEEWRNDPRTRALEYAVGVLEGHFRSVPCSLGCDIAMAWMKKVIGQKLTTNETDLLIRHMPSAMTPA